MLKLAVHLMHLHPHLVDDLRILVIVLLELLQAQLLLGKLLALGLLALLLLHLDLLLEFLLAAMHCLSLYPLSITACSQIITAPGVRREASVPLPLPLSPATWAAWVSACCPADSGCLH